MTTRIILRSYERLCGNPLSTNTNHLRTKTGTIPASLGNLKMLDGILGLSGNNLGPGSVPAQLGALKRLSTLDLRNNDMLCGALDFTIQTLDAEVLITGTHINSPCYYSAGEK